MITTLGNQKTFSSLRYLAGSGRSFYLDSRDHQPIFKNTHPARNCTKPSAKAGQEGKSTVSMVVCAEGKVHLYRVPSHPVPLSHS